MSLGVVVVSHRSEVALPRLLDDLESHEPRADVVVVDAGTPGGPPAVLAGMDLISLPDNVGFGAACNAGAEQLVARGAEYIAFLNPDIRLRGASLSQVVQGLLGQERVGIATGPIVDEQGVRQPSAWGPTSPVRAFWFASGLQFRQVRRLLGRATMGGAMASSSSLVQPTMEVDGHVLGGAMIVRRSCWRDLDGFDEGFFLYWEDADLCLRARRQGWAVAMIACTPIVHIGGGSSAEVTDTQRWGWYVDGAERFAAKHLSPLAARALLAAVAAGWRFRRLSSRGDQSRSPNPDGDPR